LIDCDEERRASDQSVMYQRGWHAGLSHCCSVVGLSSGRQFESLTTASITPSFFIQTTSRLMTPSPQVTVHCPTQSTRRHTRSLHSNSQLYCHIEQYDAGTLAVVHMVQRGGDWGGGTARQGLSSLYEMEQPTHQRPVYTNHCIAICCVSF